MMPVFDEAVLPHLLTSDASDLLLLKPRLRLDVMTALGMLARVLGMRERWRAIREAYGLKWSREMSYVPAILTSQTYFIVHRQG